MRCQQFSIKETLSDPFGGFVSLDARLTVYLVENTPEIDASRLHPMVLICPGGGYTMTSDREAEPVAPVSYTHLLCLAEPPGRKIQRRREERGYVKQTVEE